MVSLLTIASIAYFALTDKDRKIRGYYSGTDAEDVDRLIAHLKEFVDAK